VVLVRTSVEVRVERASDSVGETQDEQAFPVTEPYLEALCGRCIEFEPHLSPRRDWPAHAEVIDVDDKQLVGPDVQSHVSVISVNTVDVGLELAVFYLDLDRTTRLPGGVRRAVLVVSVLLGRSGCRRWGGQSRR
jgi:hypothetical protein